MTILLTPFMSCSAKLPIYSLFAAAFFFPQYAGLVMVLLYFYRHRGGRAGGTAAQENGVQGRGRPLCDGAAQLSPARPEKTWHSCCGEKGPGLFQKAFTVIFAATIVIWFLQNFDLQLRMTADPQASILPALRAISPRCSGLWALRTGASPPPSSPASWQRRAWCPRCSSSLAPKLRCRRPSPRRRRLPCWCSACCTPLHRGGGLGQAGAGQQVGGHHGGEPVPPWHGCALCWCVWRLWCCSEIFVFVLRS